MLNIGRRYEVILKGSACVREVFGTKPDTCSVNGGLEMVLKMVKTPAEQYYKLWFSF